MKTWRPSIRAQSVAMNSKTIEKPEYRVPSMEEIAERPKNALSGFILVVYSS